jgi:hypothetical protein
MDERGRRRTTGFLRVRSLYPDSSPPVIAEKGIYPFLKRDISLFLPKREISLLKKG